MVRADRRITSQDGSVAITVALSMVFFLSLMAIVVDLGQLFSARVVLSTATDAATLEAAEILSEGGCADFDQAAVAVAGKLQDHTTTAAIDDFSATYGLITVRSSADCLLVLTDEKVGRVDLETSDTRPYAFAGFFTTNEGTTTAAAGAEWGYIESFPHQVAPLSLCSLNAGYVNYQQYLATRAAWELNPLLPAPNPTLLDPFDVEIDGFEFSPCEGAGQFGEFVLVDYFGDSSTASKAQLRDWVENGSDDEVLIDDPGTALTDEAYCPGEDPDVLGACEGVQQSRSLDEVLDFLPVLGKSLTIMIHDVPVCDNGDLPPDFSHCDGGSRGHRSYRVDAIARVRVQCLRISATSALLSPVSAAPDLPAGFCDSLGFTTTDGNPGDDVFVRMQFLLDGTVESGNLTANPVYDHGFIGMHLCRVDGNDRCLF